MRAALLPLSGGDPVLETMLKDNMPLNRSTYIGLNWGGKPDPWTAEHEAEIPEPLRNT